MIISRYTHVTTFDTLANLSLSLMVDYLLNVFLEDEWKKRSLQKEIKWIR